MVCAVTDQPSNQAESRRQQEREGQILMCGFIRDSLFDKQCPGLASAFGDNFQVLI